MSAVNLVCLNTPDGRLVAIRPDRILSIEEGAPGLEGGTCTEITLDAAARPWRVHVREKIAEIAAIQQARLMIRRNLIAEALYPDEHLDLVGEKRVNLSTIADRIHDFEARLGRRPSLLVMTWPQVRDVFGRFPGIEVPGNIQISGIDVHIFRPAGER